MKSHEHPIACKLLFALLLMGWLPSASAACLHWGAIAPLHNPKDSLIFAGTLGQRYIRMRLHLDPATGRLDGAYGYNNEPGTLTLVGYMLKDGSGVNLIELDKRGKMTGFFNLSFSPPTSFLGAGDPRKDDRAAFEKQWNDDYGECWALTGVWGTSSRPGTSAKAVVVQQAGTLDPKERKAQLANEATAYAFMQAFMHNDRKKVVSLLHYPLHSYDQAPGRGGVRTWETPESVLNNYAEIMQFENEYLRRWVPHMLGAYDGLTDFMNGSMEIYNGKITWICAGSCPVMPWCAAASSVTSECSVH